MEREEVIPSNSLAEIFKKTIRLNQLFKNLEVLLCYMVCYIASAIFGSLCVSTVLWRLSVY